GKVKSKSEYVGVLIDRVRRNLKPPNAQERGEISAELHAAQSDMWQIQNLGHVPGLLDSNQVNRDRLARETKDPVIGKWLSTKHPHSPVPTEKAAPLAAESETAASALVHESEQSRELGTADRVGEEAEGVDAGLHGDQGVEGGSE